MIEYLLSNKHLITLSANQKKKCLSDLGLEILSKTAKLQNCSLWKNACLPFLCAMNTFLVETLKQKLVHDRLLCWAVG